MIGDLADQAMGGRIIFYILDNPKEFRTVQDSQTPLEKDELTHHVTLKKLYKRIPLKEEKPSNDSHR